MDSEVQLRILAWAPPEPGRREKLRQLVWGLLHIVSEARPGVYAVNQAGWGKRLFTTSSYAEAQQKGHRVHAELQDLDFGTWCERYRVEPGFVDCVERPERVRGLRRFRPLL